MVINSGRLEEVAMGDKEFLVELIDLYLEDAPSQLQALASAVSQQDPSAVCRAAHKLKGSCGNVGAEGLVELCHQLETLGRANQTQPMPELYERVMTEFGQVNEALLAVKSDSQSSPG